MIVGKGVTMKRKRVLVDKALGLGGAVTCLALALLLFKTLRAAISGPTLQLRLFGAAGTLVVPLVMAVVAYPTVLLLRYPSIRRTSAEKIGRYAGSHPEPLTPCGSPARSATPHGRRWTGDT
jgi:hypothetical protein